MDAATESDGQAGPSENGLGEDGSFLERLSVDPGGPGSSAALLLSPSAETQPPQPPRRNRSRRRRNRGKRTEEDEDEGSPTWHREGAVGASSSG